eukprot:TCONS_00037747-protein
MMAPQVMLDENGEVVINETSLTIRKAVDDSELKKSAVLYEDSMSTNTHRRRVSRVKRWRMDGKGLFRLCVVFNDIHTPFSSQTDWEPFPLKKIAKNMIPT